MPASAPQGRQDVLAEDVDERVEVLADVVQGDVVEPEVGELAQPGGVALGFDDIAIHHVGQDLDAFIDAFGAHVLPELR